jgi:hypothetical protein
MVLSGLQLSGALLVTVELCSVTLVFPVAIPPPPEPLLNRTDEPEIVVVPRLDSPPRPPDTLFTIWLWVMWDIAALWVFRPPPLIGAWLPEMLLSASVSVPKLIMPPPPTPVVVFWVMVALSRTAVAPAEFDSAPPLAALFPENVTFLIRRVPAFRMPPPSPAVLPFWMDRLLTSSAERRERGGTPPDHGVPPAHQREVPRDERQGVGRRGAGDDAVGAV